MKRRHHGLPYQMLLTRRIPLVGSTNLRPCLAEVSCRNRRSLSIEVRIKISPLPRATESCSILFVAVVLLFAVTGFATWTSVRLSSVESRLELLESHIRLDVNINGRETGQRKSTDPVNSDEGFTPLRASAPESGLQKVLYVNMSK